MTVSEEGKRRLANRRFAEVDIALAVDTGMPKDAYDEDGYLDVERIVALGYSIDPDGSFTPPMSLHVRSAYYRRGDPRRKRTDDSQPHVPGFTEVHPDQTGTDNESST